MGLNLLIFLFCFSTCGLPAEEKSVDLNPTSSIFHPSSQTTDPDFRATQQNEIVSSGAKLELIWGEGKFTEGPVVLVDGSVLFSDIRRNRIMKWSAESMQTTVFREETHATNGLALKYMADFTAAPVIINCEGNQEGGRRISATFNDVTTTIVDQFEGKKLNSPNDVAIGNSGRIYFTDPRYGDQSGRELDFEGVFVVEKNNARLATRNVERPNGIAITADEKYAYVADNNNAPGGARKLFRFDIEKDGTFTNRKEIYDFGEGRGVDGMALDKQGRIFATAGKGELAGVYVFGPQGEQLALIRVPDTPTNCAIDFENRFLYITAAVAPKSEGPKKFGLFRIKLR
ncbi:MAG: SMP-30/gluconolactonase/LRE family protein [Planctomycetota bacterium]